MDIEQEILAIKERNKKVESDKAWETSWSRKILISVATYFLVLLFFLILRVQNPWQNALIPTIAYFISSSTMSFAKKIWVGRVYKK
ncbi:hypothetical protein A3H26_03910 [candidate division WWE3 bacterium RIFCSPLOWO2_12_FULL_36_10]|uniref:2TM domain-containing protein n=1 Tax=candidate division WWE3 bacterium RIFCSPLOWO2_12_FULL_36_10 TaxID=1802630 RepID=A0A1F4VKT5_UNCKA|nr:MAG: hypothetical protein A3H26_03910 [candidate division WWE3 bacterium RIFCSPLOWO2_12_FULL_36_10]